MADNAIVIEIQAVYEQASAAFKTVAAEAQATGKNIEAAFSSIGGGFGLAAIAAAAAGAIAGLRSIEDMADRVKTNLDEAANSMKNLGGSLDKVRLQAFIDQLGQGSARGVASVTELYEGVQQLGTHVTSTAEMERALADATELAAAKHMDFSEAVNLVGRVLSGHLQLLTRAGILTADEAKHIHTVEQAMEVLEQKTKGATGAIDEHTKAWGGIQNQWQSVEIQLGTALNPLMGLLRDGLSGMLGDLHEAVPAISAFAGMLSDAIRPAFDLMQTIWVLASAIEHLGASLAHFLAGTFDTLRGNLKDARDQFSAMTDQMNAAGDVFKSLGAIWSKGWVNPFAQAAAAGSSSSASSAFGGDAFSGDVTGRAGGGDKNAPGTATVTIVGIDLSKWLEKIANSFRPNNPYAGDPLTQNLSAQEVVKAQMEGLRYQKASAQQSGSLTPEASAKLDEKSAELAQELARLQVAFAQTRLAMATTESARIQAQNELDSAQEAAVKATNDFALAQQDASEAWRKMYPEIAHLADLWNNLIGVSNNLGSFWSQLASQSIAVQDALRILQNFFIVLARILDAVLVPIILIVNRVLTDLANIIIDVWNTFATLLNALGIHVDYVKHINSLLGDLSSNVRPLIDIVHDLPTLKEYGAGKWGPLEPDQYGSGSSLGGLLTTQQVQTSLLGRIVGVLGAIFAIDWLTHSKFVSDMAMWFNGLWTKAEKWWSDLSAKSQREIEGAGKIALGVSLLNTHATGIIGTLERIYGMLEIIKGVLTIIQALTGAKSLASGAGGLLSLFGFGPAAAIPTGESAINTAGFSITPLRSTMRGLASITEPIAALAGSVRALAANASRGGGSSSTDNSTSFEQNVGGITVNGTSNLQEVMAALGFEAMFYGRGRAYQQGYQGL